MIDHIGGTTALRAPGLTRGLDAIAIRATWPDRPGNAAVIHLAKGRVGWITCLPFVP